MSAKCVRAVARVACALPALGIGVEAARGALGANPIETLTHATGEWALRFLLASLAVTPFRRALGWSAIAPWRRTFGLASFAYASAHVAIWCALDLGLDVAAMLEDVGERPYVTAGALAFLCLLVLAATSPRAVVRRLGRRWGTVHRLVYLAAPLALIHFAWGAKADLAAPLAWGVVLVGLLALRAGHALPASSRRAIGSAAAPAARRSYERSRTRMVRRRERSSVE